MVSTASQLACALQDPFLAVKEEVEHSVGVVVELHKKWSDLATASTRGDEFEWTSSELLSGLRSIDWDLQDLEDTVSILEGNRQKFQLDDAEMQVSGAHGRMPSRSGVDALHMGGPRKTSH